MNIIVEIAPIVISLIALLLSISTAWNNRKTLQVEIRKNLEVTDAGSVFFIKNNQEPDAYSEGLLTIIEIVNPSPKDIAFFDLRAFYPETNMNLPLVTRKTLTDEYRNKICWRAVSDSNGNVNLMELNIPDTNYGVLKANSFTRFHILMFPEHSAQKMNLSFKVAIKSKIKDQFAVTGRKAFKFYGVSYDINSWNDKTHK